MNKVLLLLFAFQTCYNVVRAQVNQNLERYRPQYHFTPAEHWMNDPNGMVYKDGKYHLFYQHNPGSSKWGPMHWGHATSKDLVQWDHQPIALYPDSLGTIFSGSAVVDKDNTAGFGNGALVALYTSNFEERVDGNRKRTQTQSIAYSIDNGKTWNKYAGNPVLDNPGKRAYRDPKVIWHEPSSHWIMSITEGEVIGFYASKDLKSWDKLSEFGEGIGVHGGVWECPDLFPIKYRGKDIWVLIVSINPKGPNGGSGTQYFLGDFDGKNFTPIDTEVRWLDWGTDNYAGVTWSNTGDKLLFIGWMSNWLYANTVPTEKWRSTMTTSRELSIAEMNGKLYLKNFPIATYDNYFIDYPIKSISTSTVSLNGLKDAFRIELSAVDLSKDFALTFATKLDEELIISYSKVTNEFAINRSETGKVRFYENFAKKMFAPNILDSKEYSLDIYVDNTSVEVFINRGELVLTSLFFNDAYIDELRLKNIKLEKINKIQSWKK